MARRKSVDGPQYIRLTEAQRVFAFRNLKQLIYYLSVRGSRVRQRRRGQRRWVCVADLAGNLLQHDPRSHLLGVLSPDRLEIEVLYETNHRLHEENTELRRKNKELRQKLATATSRLTRQSRGTGGRQRNKAKTSEKEARLVQENASLSQENSHLGSQVLGMEAFLRESGLFEDWQRRWVV
jgi:hypothetical protein